MKRLTVQRDIYGKLKLNGRANKAEILRWEIYYEEQGKKKTANKDTVARELRKLTENGWLKQEEVGGQAYYWVSASKIDEITPEVLIPLKSPQNAIYRAREGEVEGLLAKGYVKV